MGHSVIWSPHIWHSPWPHKKIIFLRRSKQTGHIVYKKNICHKKVLFSYVLCTHLFFYVLKLLLQLLDVIRVSGVSTSIVHQRSLRNRSLAGRRLHFLLDISFNFGNDAEAARADCHRYHQFYLCSAHYALLHDLGAALAGTHVPARFEENSRFLVGTDQALFDLEKTRNRVTRTTTGLFPAIL